VTVDGTLSGPVVEGEGFCDDDPVHAARAMSAPAISRAILGRE
jgi:hypothetical protein